MNAQYLYVLDSVHAASSKRAGAKAAALSRLAAHFDVPPFFVISAEAFTEAGMKPAAASQLSSALTHLGEGPFAVRSSAQSEDGAAHAHAGQFQTELNVSTDGVAAAAFRVWRSGFADSVSAYSAAHGLDADADPPSIIVQKMLAPEAAGIAFSACPLSGDTEIAVVSAVRGLADKLAQGEIEGDTYRIGQAFSAELCGEAPVLSEQEARAVAALARACAERCEAPQDIEWAIEAGKIYLLQSRPITTLGRMPEIRIWDNSNIVESYPGVVSTLTFTFASYAYEHVYRAFAALMGVAHKDIEANAPVFATMLERIDGRVYYDLLNWYRALALFPGFKSNRAFMEEMMGVAEALPKDLADRLAPAAEKWIERFRDRAKLARVAFGLLLQAARLPRTRAHFYARLNTALATPNADIDAMSASQLAHEYAFLEDLLLTRWDAPLINDFLCMISFGASRRLMHKWVGDAGLALHADLMIGQGDIVSAEPARRIREMGALLRDNDEAIARLEAGDLAALDEAPGLRTAFDAYIAKFSDRCVQELKLESQTLDEDPAQLLRAIAASARAPRSEAAAAIDLATRLNGLLPRAPLKRAIARIVLNYAKARVRDRENLRFERTRLFGRVRRIFAAIGRNLHQLGLIDDARDVFHLSVREAIAAAEGASDNLRGLAFKRCAEDRASAARADPPERITHGIQEAPRRSGEPQGEVRTGQACCAGSVMARVRIITDPRAQTLQPGEILVARVTDPGWIAVFANAAGIIAERGSLLSHSAIVARELGLPCVVALKGATAWLKTGDLVRLDGATGHVERITP